VLRKQPKLKTKTEAETQTEERKHFSKLLFLREQSRENDE
jgi:hypothetical protein